MFTTPAVDVVGLTKKGRQAGHFDKYRSRVRGLPEFGGELPVAALAEEIVALAAQAFLTGTDPVLFESLAGRASFYAVEEAGGRSSVQHRSMP